jgi:hypothetical protein
LRDRVCKQRHLGKTGRKMPEPGDGPHPRAIRWRGTTKRSHLSFVDWAWIDLEAVDRFQAE